MSVPAPGAIDCDIHPALPSMQVLVPYLDEYWRSHILMRGLERDNYTASAFPPNAPINCRPDWKPAKGSAGTDLDLLRSQALDAFGTRYAICNVLHGAPAVFSEDLSAAMCRAINDWLAAEWLSTRRPRCAPRSSCRCTARSSRRKRSSACAADPRFVQVLVWEMSELPLGRRQHWPIYRAAERLDLPIGIHAGSSYRHPPTNLGWPSYYLEDYVSWSTGFRRRAEQPDHRGRVRRIPAPEGRADGIRRDLAARLDVARRQDLARRARRGAVAGEIARRPMRASTCA